MAAGRSLTLRHSSAARRETVLSESGSLSRVKLLSDTAQSGGGFKSALI